MWLKLGIPRPGKVVTEQAPIIWVNTDHIVRVEFLKDNSFLTATVISVKPGGSDRTIFKGDDAERIKLALENAHLEIQPKLDFEQNNV